MHDKPDKRAVPSNGHKLLIIEDEAVIRFVLRCELEQRGFTVTEVENGKAALETFRRDPHAWVGAFVDFLLPDTRGDELIDQFLAIRPGFPMILMSGDIDPELERMAQERALPILRKPFPLERVRPLVAEMLRQSERGPQGEGST